MNGIRIILLCLSAAFVCAAIRAMHPQIASAVALAAGVAAIMLSASEISSFSKVIGNLKGSFDTEETGLLKICGIALVAEFASDLCSDSGEKSLANRIDTGVRISIAAASLSVAGKILNQIAELTR